jgi:predicted alpha/beta superfamily hydrolase
VPRREGNRILPAHTPSLLDFVAPHVAGAYAIRRARAPRAYFFFGPALGGVFVGFGLLGSTPFTHCVLS